MDGVGAAVSCPRPRLAGQHSPSQRADAPDAARPGGVARRASCRLSPGTCRARRPRLRGPGGGAAACPAGWVLGLAAAIVLAGAAVSELPVAPVPGRYRLADGRRLLPRPVRAAAARRAAASRRSRPRRLHGSRTGRGAGVAPPGIGGTRCLSWSVPGQLEPDGARSPEESRPLPGACPGRPGPRGSPPPAGPGAPRPPPGDPRAGRRHRGAGCWRRSCWWAGCRC